jgi:2'-hydroxyisoflavone reductase
VFVSTLSVSPDNAPAGTNEQSPTHQPPFPDTEKITAESYGPLKMACELEAQAAFPGRCLVVRPGYIVSPHDPTDRFTYWVRRAAGGGTMLAPGPQDLPLQVVDVRDLGEFTLDHLEAGTADVFGVVGPREPLTWSGALSALVTAGRAGTSSRGWTSPSYGHG